MVTIKTESSHGILRMSKLNRLISEAKLGGAAEAVIVDTNQIVIDDALADFCLKPGCENYGLSGSCPSPCIRACGFQKKYLKRSARPFFSR